MGLNDINSLSHSKWNCKYHVVFAPKYRRKVFYGEKRIAIGKILRQLCEWKGINIIEAEGFCSNMAGLYKVEDTINACFKFDCGITGSASWCFVAHESARTDRIEIVGENGTIAFSVFDYKPITLDNQKGHQEFSIPNPPHVQQPLIQLVVDHLRGISTCDCDNNAATSVNWVMDKILGVFRLG